jgi:hypothetical protein
MRDGETKKRELDKLEHGMIKILDILVGPVRPQI